MRPALALLLLPWLCMESTYAQTSPARGPVAAPAPTADDIPITDYLGLLEQIAPAAREGAQAYLQAFRKRCGRAMSAAELRGAIAEQDGNPVLMQMIRASYLNDVVELTRLAAQVPCPRGASQ